MPVIREFICELGWDPILIYVDRAVGLPPTGIDPKAGDWLSGDPKKTQGNGWRKVELYGESDFNDMDLASAVEPPPVG